MRCWAPSIRALRVLEATLDRARAGLAAEMLGAAAQSFDVTLEYLKTRTQFGQLIGTFQALQHRAAKMFTDLELTRSCVEAALAAIDRNANDVPALCSLAKAQGRRRLAHLVSNEMVQMHGGIGMTDAHDAGLYLKRARAAEATFGGASYPPRPLREADGILRLHAVSADAASFSTTFDVTPLGRWSMIRSFTGVGAVVPAVVPGVVHLDQELALLQVETLAGLYIGHGQHACPAYSRNADKDACARAAARRAERWRPSPPPSGPSASRWAGRSRSCRCLMTFSTVIFGASAAMGRAGANATSAQASNNPFHCLLPCTQPRPTTGSELDSPPSTGIACPFT